MFRINTTYRVHVIKGDTFVEFEGSLLSMHNGIIQLDIGGVKTMFSLASSAVAYLEEVDAQAEEARQSANISAWISSNK